MPTVSTMGLDTAKLVFQVHGVGANGLVVKAVRRRSRFELNSDQCRSFDTFAGWSLTVLGRGNYSRTERASSLGITLALAGGRPNAPTRKVFNMTGGNDDYGDAFKEAKLEHDQRRQGSAKEQRLQAEADAAAAALSDVVLPQLQAVAEKLEPLGGRVDIRRYGRIGKSLRPTSVAFRITDRQGHESRVYLIVPRGGMVTVTSGDGFGLTGEPQQAVNASEKVGIQKRDDLTIENVKKLILGAIAEYRNDRKHNQRADNNDDPE